MPADLHPSESMSQAVHRRTALIIAGEFPPIKTIGRFRSAKLVEYLQARGWHCVVVGIALGPDGLPADPALEQEIPMGAELRRAPMPDLELMLANRVKRLLGMDAESPGASVPGHGAPLASAMPADSAASGSGGAMGSLLATAAKSVLRNFVYIPDPYVTWIRGALREAEAAIEAHRPDVLFTSIPPFSAALIGYRLKRRHGIPWVLDYRDLWTGDVLREWVGPIRGWLERRMERRVVSAADAVVAVSEQKTAFLRALHPKAAARFETLTNGYDPEVYDPLLAEPRPVDDLIDFTFTGRLFKNRRGYAFAEALGQLVEADPRLRDRVRVRFFGGVTPEIQERYDTILARYGMTSMFEFLGDVPTDTARRAQVATDYLLLIVDTGATSDGVIPGKLFEYVAARRPIFALCDPGATQEIIERGRIGTVVPAESVERCREALARWLSRPVPERLERDEAYLGQFERVRINERFETLFESVSNGASSPSDALPPGIPPS